MCGDFLAAEVYKIKYIVFLRPAVSFSRADDACSLFIDFIRPSNASNENQIIRVIVVGCKHSGKTTLLDKIKTQAQDSNPNIEYFEVSESNGGAEPIISAYNSEATGKISSFMLFLVDLTNEASLMALSDISKRFRGS